MVLNAPTESTKRILIKRDSKNYEFRLPKVSDAPAMLRMIRAAASETKAKVPQANIPSLVNAIQLSETSPDVVLVRIAESNGKVIGMVAALCAPLLYDMSTRVAYIHFIYAIPDARGRMARQAFRLIETWAKTCGATKVYTGAPDTIPATRLLYHQFGYHDIETNMVKEL